MKITINEKAHQWYKDEMGVPEGKGIRFLGKVYGNSPVHEGFSIGIQVDEPLEPIALTEVDDISYFVEDADEWFFHGYDLEVAYDEENHEPEYLFHEKKE